MENDLWFLKEEITFLNLGMGFLLTMEKFFIG